MTSRVSPSRPGAIGLWPLLLALGGGLSFGAFLLEPTLNALRHLDPKAPLQQLINPVPQEVLILGTDRSGALTDVIASLHLHRGSAGLIQVPRDTYINSPQYGEIKANALYALGGIDAVEQELSQLLGRPVQHHIVVNLEAVRHLGDALGGLEITVPKRLNYHDYSQNLHIELEAGPQTLKGTDLEGFLRFRHDEEGDLGRMDRQRLAFAALIKKLSQPQTLTQLPQLLTLAGKDIKTDLNPLQLIGLASAITGKKLESSRLPGHPEYYNGVSYWFLGQAPGT
jgi:polyisoprenyl-teichoic acid--peptidoglycan teichoic acid transferase